MLLLGSLLFISIHGTAAASCPSDCYGNQQLDVYNSCSGSSTLYIGEHVTTNLTGYSFPGRLGTFDWQLQIYTDQSILGFQAGMNQQNGKVQNFSAGVLDDGFFPLMVQTPDWDIPAANTSIYVDFYVDVSGGNVTSFNFDVYKGGTYQDTYQVSLPSTGPSGQDWLAPPVAFQSDLLGHPGTSDGVSNFISGAGYWHYQASSAISTAGAYTCPGIAWGTVENSNMQYASSLSSCNAGDTICYQDYNAPSGSWTTSYFTNPNDSNTAWNSQSLSSSSVQTGNISPTCPAEVSVQVSGSTSNDPYQRDFSLNFTGSLGTDSLYYDYHVRDSFSINETIPETYLTMNSSDSINFDISMGAGYSWSITATMHYYSLTSCVS